MAELFDDNAGTNKLANVLSSRMKRESDDSLVLDFGEIQTNGSLLTNTFPVAIPKGEYTVCLHVTEYSTTASISAGTVSGGMTTHSGHSHGFSGNTGEGDSFSGTTETAGSHTHTLTSLTDKKASMTVHNALKAGDRVLVAWVQSEAVVIDRITSS